MAIHKALKGQELQNISLFEGQAGKILFDISLAENNYTCFDNEEILRDINLIYSKVNDLDNLSLSRGLAGIFYLKDYLIKNDLIDFEKDEVEISDFFYSHSLTGEIDMDYLHGMNGIILRELEGKERIDNKLMDRWIEFINKKCEATGDGEIKWKIASEQSDGEFRRVYSLGLAHGTPSLILILLKLYKRRRGQLERAIMDGAVKFLLNSKYKEQVEFTFPNQIIDGVKSRSRLAWCYGDLGCALALFLYGKEVKNNEIIKFAENVFDSHLSKLDPVKYNVLDADFCHGSVGIAHIYARMYNYTNYERYREYSEYWYKVTLDKANFGDGLAGFKHYAGDTGYVNNYGLLEGIIGIGLSLISAINKNEPKWDRCLLLSC